MAFNPDRVNIHELTIEDPEKKAELPFDVETEITPEDWASMKDELQDCRTHMKRKKKADWRGFSVLATQMKILDPKAEIGIGQEDWKGIKGELSKDKREGAWSEFYAQAARMKILDQNMDIDLPSGSIEDARDEIDRYKKVNGGAGQWTTIPSLAVRRKTLYPRSNTDMSDKDWQSMKNELMSYADGSKGNWTSFCLYASEMKILDPGVNLELTEKVWQEMKGALQECRNDGNWIEFSQLAVAMKVLAAEKVEMTDKGLNIIMPKPKKIKPDAPPMPETKKF